MPAPRPNRVKTSDLKSKILNLAQTSVYQVKIQPPPSVSAFLALRGIYYGTDGENLELLCSETALPGTSLFTHEATNDYHGVTEKMAYRRSYDDALNMTFYVDRDRRPLFYYYQDSKNGNVYINYDRMWVFFNSIFGLNALQTKEILTIWLEQTYNLRGVTPNGMIVFN